MMVCEIPPGVGSALYLFLFSTMSKFTNTTPNLILFLRFLHFINVHPCIPFCLDVTLLHFVILSPCICCPVPLRSSAVPEATTDIRHLVQHIVARAPNAHGHARYLCRIFGNADEALKTTGGWVYFKSLGESDIEPAKLKRFLDKEAKMTKESRHQRALKTDIPLMSEVELNAAKKAKPRSKKRITNTTSAAGVGSPFDLKRVQGDFKKREPALLEIIGGQQHPFVR